MHYLLHTQKTATHQELGQLQKLLFCNAQMIKLFVETIKLSLLKQARHLLFNSEHLLMDLLLQKKNLIVLGWSSPLVSQSPLVTMPLILRRLLLLKLLTSSRSNGSNSQPQLLNLTSFKSSLSPRTNSLPLLLSVHLCTT